MSGPEEVEDGGGSRFPFINLEKAIGRAKQLFDAASAHPMTTKDAFATWGYSEKSSGGFQTVGALRSYGLLKSIRNGADSGKISLTADAIRYFKDERPEEHLNLAKTFALRPGLIKALWARWGFTPPAEHIARSHLKVDRSLSEQNARTLLGIYQENIEFAKLKSDTTTLPENGGKQAEHGEKPSDEEPPPPPPPAGRVRIMDGERIVFTEEGQPNQYVKLIASGDFDDTLLEALEDFVKRQRKRLGLSAQSAGTETAKPN